MYPYLSDLLNDLFNTDWFVFPGQTFGFFVALAFVVAYQTLKKDFQLREAAGQFKLARTKILVSVPVEKKEIGVQGLVWGLLGYKLGHGFLNWDTFSSQPADLLFSLEGNILLGIIAGAIGAGWRYMQFKKTEGQEKVYEEKLLGPSRFLGTIVTIAFIAGILGSKVFHHLEYLDELFQDPYGQIFSASGLSFLGGLLTAGFLIARYLYKKGYNLYHMMDVFAPCLILAYAVGRIGCQLSGDGDWGTINPSPQPEWLAFLPEWTWAFDFPGNVANEGIPIPGCKGQYCRVLETPVWPTPIYETTMGLIIFGVLWALRNRLPFVGQLSGIYFFLIGLERFLIEGIRVNPDYHFLGMSATQAELISIALMLVGVIVFVHTTFIYKTSPPRLSGDELIEQPTVSEPEEEKSTT